MLYVGLGGVLFCFLVHQIYIPRGELNVRCF